MVGADLWKNQPSISPRRPILSKRDYEQHGLWKNRRAGQPLLAFPSLHGCSRITAHAQEETSRTIPGSSGRPAKLTQSGALPEIPAREDRQVLCTPEKR